jgi:hypothetical protein
MPPEFARPLDCILQSLHAPMHVLMTHMTSTMGLVISIDRLLAVSFPLHYFGWGMTYALGLTGGAYYMNLLVECVLYVEIVIVLADCFGNVSRVAANEFAYIMNVCKGCH